MSQFTFIQDLHRILLHKTNDRQNLTKAADKQHVMSYIYSVLAKLTKYD